MQILCLSSSTHLCTPYSAHASTSRQQHLCLSSSFHGLKFNPPRVSLHSQGLMMFKKRRSRTGAVCLSAPLSINELQWLSTVSSAVLMLVKGTGIQKSFLVPLIALQAPSSIVSWMRGEYGIWCAFMAILVRVFFFIPGELELPFMALLLTIVAPYQVMNLRGKQEGVVLSLALAAYLAFQHFFRAGSIKNAIDQGSIATLAIIFTVAVPCLMLI